MTQVAGRQRLASRWLIDKSEVESAGGMVTAKHRLAAEAGLAVLERGGNAVDAAVTTAFATSVVLPFSNGLGGGGYLVAYLAGQRRAVVIDYSMTAAAAAHETMYELVEGSTGSGVEGDVDLSAAASPFGWHLVRNNDNWQGWRSMCVPGTVMGLARALERFGTISLEEAVQPAIRLAEEGWEVDWLSALSFAQQMDLICRYPSSKAIFSRDGLPLRPRGTAAGDTVRNPALGRTLRAIAAGGVAEFYRGRVARDIAADMREGGGLVTEDDLAAYEVFEKEPLRASYRDLAVYAVPHASAGPTLVEGLSILAGFDLAALGHNTPAYLHLLAEAFRQAYADRFAYMADPRFVDVPWTGMASAAYAAAVRAQIDPRRARPRVEANDPWAHEGRPAPRRYEPSRPFQDAGTTHINACDRDGNLVSLTQTLLGWSGVALPRTGIVMNNGMGWFDPEPGHANSPAGGKKPLTNMTPIVATRDGEPYLAVGAPGGRRIVHAVTQVFLNLVEHGLGPQAAVSTPRIDASGPRVLANDRLGDDVIAALGEMGHRIQPVEDSFAGAAFASPAAILIDPATGVRRAGEDPWRGGVALGEG